MPNQFFIGRDTDMDGLTDYADPDDDNDGLPDIIENQLGTDPLVVDDLTQPLTDTKIDTDGDGVSDLYEINISGTDPDDPNDHPPLRTGTACDANSDGTFNVGDLLRLEQMLLEQ